MKKIVILTPRFPFPVIGGDRLRIYFLCKELSKHFSLTLLSLCESKEEMEMDVSDDTVFDNIERVYMPKWRSYFNCLCCLPTKTPLQVAYYKNNEFQKKLITLSKVNDAVFSHLVRVSEYTKNINLPKIIELTDAISMNYERVSGLAKSFGFKNLVYSLEQSRLKKYEKSIATKFDYSVLVSQIDKDYLFHPDDAVYERVLVCSNGVDTQTLSYEYGKGYKQLIFIGNLYSIQNLDAAYWFAKNVMPSLREIDDYTFKIVGRIKSNDAKKFDQFDAVYLTGSVESILDEVRGSLAGICSVRLGAGVQNKILEYMSLGIPTITSSTGLEGIEATPDKNILVADKPSEYINAILKLSKDATFAETISLNARNYVVSKHSWGTRVLPVIKACKSLLIDNHIES
ncbi:glycosyltransferase [Paraglaciecola psychrophila]|uniref:Glycosyltransferase n=1 Tax=Paraglaciecola psychrophila 170 TaxID=1129794 RepID=K7A530_9ALTE|nr:glycosyltransferase [Paraglaciecola psychrophila]AGH43752.1 hypothetical protein C427_1643 [Paraglaciecola psychrophila 170]GAC35958.1 glycosyl transferase, group 1 [Paraglaciecola psychrophila 170]